MDENKDLVRAFVRATKKGYEYAIENPKEAAEILYSNSVGVDVELIYESQKWMSPKYQGALESWGIIDPERWTLFKQWLENSKLVSGKLDIGQGFQIYF